MTLRGLVTKSTSVSNIDLRRGVTDFSFRRKNVDVPGFAGNERVWALSRTYKLQLSTLFLSERSVVFKDRPELRGLLRVIFEAKNA